MLSILGISFLASAVVFFLWTLRKASFRRYPWEIFLLLGLAVTLGALATAARFSLSNGLLLLLEIVALVASLLYLGKGARFPRNRLTLESGQRMPSFSLPDSTGKTFHSESLDGKSAALYLFYRGDW